MPPPPPTLTTLPEAFVFDVFGTVFDWRSTVTSHLQDIISRKLKQNPSLATSPTVIAANLTNPESLASFCVQFAQDWRDSYKHFVATYGLIQNPGNSDENVDSLPSAPSSESNEDYPTIDHHHLTSLITLLKSHNLDTFFTPSEIFTTSRIWHSLIPWPDSKPGIQSLRELAVVSTLSNGNVRLLVDLEKNSGVHFDLVLSGQLWRGYKPERKVYVGGCEVLGVGNGDAWRRYLMEGGDEGVGEKEWRRRERGKVAMVAAHIKDLKAAKACGLTTIFIERPGEDDNESAFEDYLKSGEDWIDMLVSHKDGGILEAANRLGKLKKVD
ncbi:hypothetical protein ABW19_dt0206520 [Dactylella cylindrospora]|nr:hypothetical protein ABW19_dt0206520 [Dactylella cylindrospora]